MRAAVLDHTSDPVPPSCSAPPQSYTLRHLIAIAKRNKVMGLARVVALVLVRPALAFILHRSITQQPWWSSVRFWLILALTCMSRLTRRFFRRPGRLRAGVYHAGHQTNGGKVATALQLQKKVDQYRSPFPYLNGDYSTVFVTATDFMAEKLHCNFRTGTVKHRKHFLNRQQEVKI